MNLREAIRSQDRLILFHCLDLPVGEPKWGSAMDRTQGWAATTSEGAEYGSLAWRDSPIAAVEQATGITVDYDDGDDAAIIDAMDEASYRTAHFTFRVEGQEGNRKIIHVASFEWCPALYNKPDAHSPAVLVAKDRGPAGWIRGHINLSA